MNVIVSGKILRATKTTWRKQIQRDGKSCYTVADKTAHGLLDRKQKPSFSDMMAELWRGLCRQ
jgi:hypothetical protein